MDYQKVFNMYFYLYFFGFVCAILINVVVWKSKSLFNEYEKIQKSKYNKQIEFAYKFGITLVTIVVFFLLIFPMFLDKKSINSNSYKTSYGTVVSIPEKNARYDYFKDIDILVDGKIMDISVVRSDKGLSNGDYVKVTWLEHSKSAVVEKCDKEK